MSSSLPLELAPILLVAGLEVPYLKSEPMMSCELATCLCKTKANQAEQDDDCMVFFLLWTVSGTWMPFSVHSSPLGRLWSPLISGHQSSPGCQALVAMVIHQASQFISCCMNLLERKEMAGC